MYIVVAESGGFAFKIKYTIATVAEIC